MLIVADWQFVSVRVTSMWGEIFVEGQLFFYIHNLICYRSERYLFFDENQRMRKINSAKQYPISKKDG